MIDRLWLFPVLLCVFISLTFSEGFHLLGFVLCVLWLIRIYKLNHRLLFKLSLGLGLLFSGVLAGHLANNHTQLNPASDQFIVYPKTTSIKVDGDQLRLDGIVQTSNGEEEVAITYTLKTEEEKEAWLTIPPMHHLRVKGELQEPALPSNFYQFNYRAYLKRQGIHWQLRAETVESIQTQTLKKPAIHLIENARHHMFTRINRNFHEKIASYIRTLFFADNRDFSEEILQQYRGLGVVHLFSISGFHITYLAHLLRKCLLKIGVTQERTNLVLVLLLPLYGLLAGFGVSVFRAVFQNVFLNLSKMRGKPIDPVDAWAITMGMALFLNPFIIYQIAFQLSYLLSGLFILIGKQPWFKQIHPLLASVLISMLSFLGSLPVLTVHFFEISWVTIGANVLFIPFFSYVLFPALLFLFFSSFLFASTNLFGQLQGILLWFIESIEQLLTLLNQRFDFSLITGRLPAFILLVLIVCIFLVVKSIENKRPLASILPGLGIILSLFYHQIAPVGYVVMLDVGQGEAILIKDPVDKKTTLIDTGGQVVWGTKEKWQRRANPFSIGKDQVVPALKALGVSKIDRLYLTHADVDHFGEMASIGQHITIAEVAASRETFRHKTALKQLKELPQMPLMLIEESQMIDFPTEQSVVILPMKENESKNNQSLVLYVTIGEENWLFTGDIEKEAERHLIKEYPSLEADYLKVAHHGSQTSSTVEFIEHVQPEAAWISVGKRNTYGHPNEEVIDRFKEREIPIYATSEQGALMKRYIKLPGSSHWYTTFQTVHTN